MLPSSARKQSLEERLRQYETSATTLLPYLAGRGLGVAALERFRLGYVETGEYAGRLAIPYLTPTGVVQIRYRSLTGAEPKYLSEPGVKPTLYNASAVLRRGPIFLTEGEFDAVAIETILGRPAVGVPGAQAWAANPHWARCFVGHDLILPADGDQAGRDLAAAVAKTLPETRVAYLPDGTDANECLARDPDDFLRRCGLA